MMLSALIQHRTEARYFFRLSPGNTPACADQQDWPVIAPQILSSNVQSARSRQHARPRFKLKGTLNNDDFVVGSPAAVA